MTDRDLEQQLNQMKDASELGGGFSVADLDRSWKNIAKQIDIDPETKPCAYSVWEYLEFLRSETTQIFLRPVAAVAGVAGLMIGGFVTTVGASASRPGDILYPVKLASERMQLSLASSPQERVQLHAQFAGERLQEAVDLGASNEADQVKATVDRFKDELSSAHGELSELSGQATTQAAAATNLANKVDTFSAILSSSEQTASGTMKNDVASAKAAAKDAQTQAVAALVNAYETDKGSVPTEDIRQNFQREYRDASSRLALCLGRLAVMREALKGLPVEKANEFRAFANVTQTNLQPFQKKLADAMDILAAGGYKRAFELVESANTALTPAEQNIAQKEIELSTLRSNEDMQP